MFSLVGRCCWGRCRTRRREAGPRAGSTPTTARGGNLSPADFLDFARETRTFTRMGAHGYVGSFTIAGSAGDAERVGGVQRHRGASSPRWGSSRRSAGSSRPRMIRPERRRQWSSQRRVLAAALWRGPRRGRDRDPDQRPPVDRDRRAAGLVTGTWRRTRTGPLTCSSPTDSTAPLPTVAATSSGRRAPGSRRVDRRGAGRARDAIAARLRAASIPT